MSECQYYEFLAIDRPLTAEEPSQKKMDDWLDGLPRDEVLTLMKQLLEGQGLKAEWKVVQRQVVRGSGLAYDEVCQTLVDISEAYALHASRDAFCKELKRFMAGHMRRKALVQRLVKAEIWQEK